MSQDKIVIDEEINIDRLGWKHGDVFRLINNNGQPQLVKLDRFEKFVRGYG